MVYLLIAWGFSMAMLVITRWYINDPELSQLSSPYSKSPLNAHEIAWYRNHQAGQATEPEALCSLEKRLRVGGYAGVLKKSCPLVS